MCKFFLSLLLGAFFIFGCKTTDVRRISDAVLGSGGQLSTLEVANGLKEALRIGAGSAGNRASKVDGFYKNKQLFIPFPKEVSKVQRTLNDIGLSSLTNSFVESMNRGAEKAAAKAKPIFLKAVTSMTIEDAWGVLRGGDYAATNYLKRATTGELTKSFKPVISDSLKKVEATRYWADISSKYNSIPLMSPVRTDLDAYVTEKALEGLFLLVSQEEKKIRDNPYNYTSSLIRKVFAKQ